MKEEITREISKYFEWNETTTLCINIYETQLRVFRMKFVALHAYIRILRFQTNNLSFHLNKLEKEEQTKYKASRKKEILMGRAEINEIEN